MARAGWVLLLLGGLLIGQPAAQAQLTPVPPPQPPPGAPVASPPAQTQPVPPAPQADAGVPAAPGGAVPIAFHFESPGADLLQVVGIIAAELRMNYVVDPQVKGTVVINTLGELRREDLFPLLQMILRINGATAVQTGNFFRVVPLQNVQRMPLEPQLNAAEANLPADDRIVMNIIPLKYVSAVDMTKILTPFLSEGGHLFSHEAGNVLIVTDSSRSMKRLIDLVAQFDTEVFSNQRARLYPVKSSQAARVATELKDVFSAYGLSAGTSAIRFVPIERVNSILVVTANPSVYPEVERWLERLDQPISESGVRTFVYKVENGKAADLANVLSQLLLGKSIISPSSAPPAGGGFLLPMQAGGMAAGQQGIQPFVMASPAVSLAGTTSTTAGIGESEESHIRIVPDPINNQILIQATAQEYEDIRRTLHDLDIVPRQVMIEAKVFEVDLNGALSAGVSAFLQNQGGAAQVPGGERKVQGSFATPSGGGAAAVTATIGTLVGKTRELLLFLNAAETRGQAHVISAPSILASDNIAANINVGTEVPLLTSQALVGGAQQGGTSLFTNTIQNRDTGVLLSITPRVNSSGLVNLQIQQEVSAPLPPAAAGIQSPSIQKRSISTQVVVQDGETIALGGIIQESRTYSRNRVPLLGDIPYVGAIFGNTSLSSARTELIVLLTPTVIRDSSEAQRATNEFRDKLKDLQKLLQQDEEKKKAREQQPPTEPSPAS
ncbi:MAG: type II secretion system secretin GspD [Acidobacteria bacterium]|nr:type II secretion system secretin GspD [Acidobacteriota bacterium]